MSKVNHKWTQGIGFKIMTDVGVSEETQLECEKAIANILLKDNDTVMIHSVGHYTYGLNKVVHEYNK